MESKRSSITAVTVLPNMIKGIIILAYIIFMIILGGFAYNHFWDFFF